MPSLLIGIRSRWRHSPGIPAEDVVDLPPDGPSRWLGAVQRSWLAVPSIVRNGNGDVPMLQAQRPVGHKDAIFVGNADHHGAYLSRQGPGSLTLLVADLLQFGLWGGRDIGPDALQATQPKSVAILDIAGLYRGNRQSPWARLPTAPVTGLLQRHRSAASSRSRIHGKSGFSARGS